MISPALASGWLMAKHQASFMSDDGAQFAPNRGDRGAGNFARPAAIANADPEQGEHDRLLSLCAIVITADDRPHAM